MKKCGVDGCDKPHAAKGFCHRHYRAWRLHGDPLRIREYGRGRICSVEGCDSPHLQHGFCKKHYKRWDKTGDVRRERDGRGRPPSPSCGFPGCREKNWANGWCPRHLKSVQRYGNVLASAQTRADAASPAIWADLRSASTMRELGRRKDVEFYLARAETHGRPLSKLEQEFADGVRMEANRERDQAVLAADVRELTAKGMSSREIGEVIGVTERTVIRIRGVLGITQSTWNNSKDQANEFRTGGSGVGHTVPAL